MRHLRTWQDRNPVSYGAPRFTAPRSSLRTALLAVADAEYRWGLREHMARQGFTVYATGEGSAALDWLTRRTFDVVVADVLLPGTRIAVPHIVRRRGRTACPKLIAVCDDSLPCDAVQSVFGYDLVVPVRTPVVVLTKAIHQLLGSDLERAPG
jgi:CheY-like chemotaxis protein